MHDIHNQRSPSYLSDTVQTVATATIRCGLRSSATTDYVVPRTLSKFGERAFAYAGPAACHGTAFQITFVASLHLQPSEDI